MRPTPGSCIHSGFCREQSRLGDKGIFLAGMVSILRASIMNKGFVEKQGNRLIYTIDLNMEHTST
jgi:hypothetical protein